MEKSIFPTGAKEGLWRDSGEILRKIEPPSLTEEAPSEKFKGMSKLMRSRL